MEEKETKSGKNPWRYLFAACAVYGAVKLLPGLWVNLLWLFFRWRISHSDQTAASIGIIGGADGPTAIFLTAPVWVHYVIPVVLLVVGILGFLRLSRDDRKK